jgi:hypothetical protein
MKRFLAALLATTAACGVASAADLAVKAPKSNLLVFPYNGDGLYWGIATKAGVEQDSASGNFLGSALLSGSANATGGGIGGTLGYMHGMGTMWAAFEGNLYYTNITASISAADGVASVPASMATRWSADEVVKIGGWNPFSWLGNFGGFTFPTLPSPPTVSGISILSTGHPYIMAGMAEWGVSGQFFMVNSGVTVGFAPLVGAGIINQIVDSTGKLTGAVLDTGAQVIFADKGFSASGLFAPGTPVLSQMSSGRKYEVYAKVDF